MGECRIVAGARWTAIAMAVAVWLSAGVGLRADAEDFHGVRRHQKPEDPAAFTFVRVQFDSMGGWGEAFYDYDGRRWQRWETDYPEADENFLFRLNELTTSSPNPDALVRRLTDEDLGQFPFIYMCDVGWMDLSKEEKQALRRYLERGGFLWADDFWGQAEWENFEYNMAGVFPEREWREIPAGHAILQVVFPLEACPQIPARDFAEGGWRWDPPGIHRQPAGGEAGVNTVNFRGLFDDEGRLMAVATHNTDIGDGFEREGYDERYFEQYSTQAYAMGINIIVYAMTH